MNRRDSFITHRAFCEALAEETARFTATSHHFNNNNLASNINYNFIGSSQQQQQQQHHLLQHFPPIFKSNPSNDPNIGRGLPIWISQGNNNNQPNLHDSIAKNLQEMQQMSTFSLDHQLIHHPPPPPSSYNTSWDFGKDQFLLNNYAVIPTTSVKEASVPSLFSTDPSQSRRHEPAFPISATALLQKAAQIGATATAADDGDRLCGLYSTTNSATSGLGSDVEVSVENVSSQVEMYPSKRCRLLPTDEEMKASGEITRDFLGVGIQAICNPTSINGWM